jgi:hypothetical protein
MLQKPKEIEVSKENPFLNDKLGRETTIRNLSQIITNANEGFVLGVNSPWGTGKTTFIRMWDQYLQNENYTTFYFNAWENDYSKEPILSLLQVISPKDEQSSSPFEKVVRCGLGVMKAAMPVTIRAISGSLLNAEALKDIVSDRVGDDITDTLGKLVDDKLQQISVEQGVQDSFRNALEGYVEETIEEGNPDKVVLFIDELDRCRPTYAVELLETIKHFFSVSNIVFVLAVDKKQLGHSISTMYGNDMDTEGYLRRFFDLNYQLPTPSNTDLIHYLFEYYSFDQFFKEREQSDRKDEGKHLFDAINELSVAYDLTLREIGHLFTHLSTALLMTPHSMYSYPVPLVYLIVEKIKRPAHYKKIITNDYNYNDIITEFKSSFDTDYFEENRTCNDIEAFMQFYFNGVDNGIRWIDDLRQNIYDTTYYDKYNDYRHRLYEEGKRYVSWNNTYNVFEHLVSKIEFVEDFKWS